MKMKLGFTLIEVLIALMIFAILATITSSVLFYAFNTRTRVNHVLVQLADLQFALSLIQRDTQQIINRPIRSNEMRLYPAFIGEANYVEFTHGGSINPYAINKMSTLTRSAFVCKNHRLMIRTWESLDPPKHSLFQEKKLLTAVDCHFAYLNRNLQVLTSWKENALDQNQKLENFPQAIQLSISFNPTQQLVYLLMIPEAVYAKTN